MHPSFFDLGSLPVHSYGVMVAIAFLCGTLLSLYYAKKEKISPENILDLALYVIISAMVGARFFYVIGQWDYFLRNPAEILMLQNGGLVFLGGFLLSIFVVIFYGKTKKIAPLKLLDVITPGVALGYAIGRIGCFLNGCCFGLPTTSPWGVIFPPGSLAAAYFPGVPVYPTQLYSSLIMFIVFLLLVWLYRAKNFNGQVFFWGLIFYSLYRFSIEFLRFSPMHWLYLTPSQWLAIFIFVFGIIGLKALTPHERI